jgi:hypothetical protein
VVLLLTEWPEFTALTPGGLGGLVARRNIIDARNALDPGTWREVGWNYRALGVADDAGPARRSVGAVPLVRDQLTDRQG